MRRFFVLFFAAATGYISLTQEMLWMRAVSYITGGEPAVFAHVLGFFLIGVAGGALWGERLCERRFTTGGRSPVRFVGEMLIASAIFYYFSIALVADLMTWSAPLGMAAVYGVVAVVSFLLGGIFTVLCHYGARAGESVGVTVSRVYLANIVGSTLGPLLSGFVLMQYLPTDRIILYLSLATALLGGAAYLFSPPGRRVAAPVAVALAVACAVFLCHPLLYPRLLEKLQYKESYSASTQYKYLLENRSGIIAVQAGKVDEHGGPRWPDLIYGGGMYDGRFNTYPANRWYDPNSPEEELRNTTDVSNYIGRAYIIAALHPNPVDVLEVGLSSASWTRVLANYSPIQRLTTVEINGGYPQIISHYPEQASVLTDPKVTVAIDDGRRWLNRHPDTRFDFILQNTTWHWRSEITDLLSVEYLQIARAHLKPGGVLYWNTTHSEDVKRTAAEVFTHVTHYANFVAASDSPFDLTPEQVRDNLLKFTDGGAPGGRKIFKESDPLLRSALAGYAAVVLPEEAPFWRSRKDLWVITDDNMATEFKRARSDLDSGVRRTRLILKQRSWYSFFKARG